MASQEVPATARAIHRRRGRAQRIVSTLALGLLALAWPADGLAQYATGGSGRFLNNIIWLSFGAEGATVSPGRSVTNRFQVGGEELAVTCTIPSIVGGNLQVTSPGSWQGDALDILYNIGGSGAANRLDVGLGVSSGTRTFDITCSATLAGLPVTLAGLVFADAEQSSSSEYVQATIPEGSGRLFRIIDRYRQAGCTGSTNAEVTRANAQLTLKLAGSSNACSVGPMAVAFMEGASSARIEVKGGGISAVALGVALANADHGDAPSSYGAAQHVQQITWTGGVASPGPFDPFAPGFTLASIASPANTLGRTLDGEPVARTSADASGDDRDAADDEDAVTVTGGALSTPIVAPGSVYTLTPVVCRGTGDIAGWVDFNRNGTFDTGERSRTTPRCGTSGQVSLDWTVPADVASGPSFLRLRTASSAAQVSSPTAAAGDGEAEDYPITVARARVALTKQVAGVVSPADQFVLTVSQGTLGASVTSGTSLTTGPVAVEPGTAVTLQESMAPGSPSPLAAYRASIACTTLGVAGSVVPAGGSGTWTLTVPSAADVTCVLRNEPARADLSITNTDGADPVAVGGTLSYTLAVTNTGPSPAASLVVTHTLPAGASFLSAAGAGWACAHASGVVTCTRASLAVAPAPAITVTATAPSTPGTVSSTATVSSALIDATPADNSATQATVVSGTAMTQTLAARDINGGSLVYKDVVEFTLTVTNTSAFTASLASGVLTLPTGLAYVPRSLAIGTGANAGVKTDASDTDQAERAGSTVQVRFGLGAGGSTGAGGSLAPGQSTTLTFRATVVAAAPGPIYVQGATQATLNGSVVSSFTDGDPVTAGVQPTTLTVVPWADLVVTSTGSTEDAPAGSPVTLTLQIRNAGPSPSTGIVVRLTPNTAFTGVTPGQGGTLSAGVVTWPAFDLAVGATRTLSLQATAPAAPLLGSSGLYPYASAVVVTSSLPDPTTTNSNVRVVVRVYEPNHSGLASPLFSTLAPGAVVAIGNTLGLGRASSTDIPGTWDKIGAFITTDQSKRKSADWPLGTTGDWREGASAAVLRLPAGAQVLRAQLVWTARCAAGVVDVRSDIDAPVTLLAPGATATQDVAPNPVWSHDIDATSATGCTYTRSADVTAFVQAAGAGAYTVGRIPAALSNATDNSAGSWGGWTMLVAYRDTAEPVRSLSIFSGLLRIDKDLPETVRQSTVTGFCTPAGTQQRGRLTVAAVDGQAWNVSDGLRFGQAAPLSSANALSGPNNPVDNFFGGLIEDESGQVDTRGTFGTRNNAPNIPVTGARTTYDLATVDVSRLLVPGQQSALFEALSRGETYYVKALGLQIEVGAPRVPTTNPLGADVATASPGTVVTYTYTLANTGDRAADNVVLRVPAPAGMTFVAGSVARDGVPVGSGDPTSASGVALGSLAAASSTVLTWQFRVASVPVAPAPARYASAATIAYDFSQCGGQAPSSQTFTTNTVTITTPRVSTSIAVPATAQPDAVIPVVASIANDGSAPTSGATLLLPIPAGFVYVPGSTRVNGVAVPDALTLMPFAIPALVNSAAQAAGVIAPLQQATVQFSVRVARSATGTVTVIGATDPDGGGSLPALVARATTTLTAAADVGVTLAGPSTTAAGQTIQFTHVVTNHGPSSASAVTLSMPTPAGLVFVSNANGCATAFPCALGTLADGASVTVVSTYTVPPAYTTPDPIVALATVASTEADPLAANNSSQASAALGAPVTDLSVTVTDGVTATVAGTNTTYTIVVGNAGPAQATGARVLAALPVDLSNVTWTCAGTAGASCASASGATTLDTTATIPPAGSVTITLTGRVRADALTRGGSTGTLPVSITTTTAAGASDPTPGHASDTDAITDSADVSLVVVAPPSIIPGAVATFTATITNAGPSDATGVQLEGTFPAGTTVAGITGCTPVAFPCTIGTITPGQSRQVTIQLAVPSDYVAPDPVVGSLRTLAATADPDAANDVATASSPLARQTDIAVGGFFSPSSVPVGQSTQLVVWVYNVGPAGAGGVEVSVPIPAGFTLAGSQASRGTYSTSTGLWTVGTMNAGDLQVLDFTLTPTVSGPIAVAITETSSGIDTNPADDATTATLNAIAANDLQVSLTADRLDPVVGGTVTLTARVRNAGPSPASDIRINIPAVAGLTFGSVTPSGAGTFAADTWTIPTLPVNGSETVTIVASVTAPGVIGVRASYVSSHELELSPINNAATVVLNGGLSADVQVTKQASTGAPSVGDQVTFTIVVRNNGPSPATAVEVTDVLPAGLALVSSIASTGTWDSGTGVWTVGDLTATQQETLAITATVTQAGAIVNAAEKTAQGDADPVSANDRSEVSLSADVEADLQITKVAGASVITPGQPIGYVITATNAGPSPVIDAIVKDPLSALFVGATWTCTASAGSSCATPSGVGAISVPVSLLSGGTATITITATVSPGAVAAGLASIDNGATVSTPGSVLELDVTNNRATASVVMGTPTVDLEVVSIAGATSLLAGGTQPYTIVLRNNGIADAVASQLSFLAPTGLVGTGTSGCLGAMPCTLPVVPAGGTLTVTVQLAVPVTLPAGVSGAITLGAAVTAAPSEVDTDPTNDTLAYGVSVSQSADRAISARFRTPTAELGTTVPLEVILRNLGPASTGGVRASVPVPSGFAFVSATVGQGTYNAQTGAWEVGTLAVGQSVTLVATLRVTTTGTLAVHVTETGSGKDPDKSNDTATATLNGTSTADVGVSLTLDRTPLVPGETAVLTLKAVNAGPNVAEAVVLGLTIPGGLTLTGSTASQGAFDPGTGLWTIGDLPSGASVVLTASVRVDVDGAFVIEGRLTSTGATTIQVNPANDRDSVSLNGLATADIEVTKDVSATTVLPGQSVTYTVRAHNHGPFDASSVQVTDILPPGLTLASAKASQGSYDLVTGAWSVGTLGVSDTAALVVIAAASPSSTGVLVNTARLTASALSDPDATNDEASQVLSISQPIALGVTAFLGTGDPSTPGATIDYTLWLGSAGVVPGPTTITLLLPSSFAFVSGPAGWTCAATGTQVTCIGGTFDPSAGALAFRAQVLSPLPVGTPTTVTVSNVLDTTLGDNFDSFVFGALGASQPVDLRVTAALSVPTVDAGCSATPTTLTMQVSNVDALGATGVLLAADLPGVQVLSATASSGSCSSVGGVLFCSMGNLAAGASATVTVRLVASTAGTPVFNIAALAAEPEATPIDNFTSVTLLARSLDTDSDGMPDAWETRFGLDPADPSDAGLDPDGDGLTNLAEFQACGHPNGTAVRLLPEGVSNDVFSTRVVIFNAGQATATAQVRALPEGTSGVPVVYTLAPGQRLELDGAQYAGLTPVAYGTLVEADEVIAVERTTSWDRSGYGSQGDAAIDTPSRTWYFAEGATGQFGLFYLLANPGTQDAVVEARFLQASSSVAPLQVTVPAGQRVTLWANRIAGLEHAETGAAFTVLSGPPIGVARSMYLDDVNGRFFGVGHSGNGVSAPAITHALPEGAAGFFDLFYLLANPDGARDADVRLTFGLEDGTSVTQDVTVPAGRRANVWVNALAAASTDPLVRRLGQSAMTTTVESRNGVPVLAERAMYWPAGAWLDGSAGGIVPGGAGQRWAIADAQVDGSRPTDTFVLVGNDEAVAGTVTVTLHFDDGSTATRDYAIASRGRLTVWLDQDFPTAANRSFAVTIASTTAVIVERATYGSDAEGRGKATGHAVPATRLP